jgi:electron transfer flavoprotein beta subunit
VNIVVCIKQVVGSSRVGIDPKTGTLLREGVDAIINPFDEYALEEALRVREQVGGSVQVVTMGPARAESALRFALGMGADEGHLITDRVFAGSDTWATAHVLSRALGALGPVHLVFCGKQAIDGDTAQVGPSLAEMLGVPHVACVRRIVALRHDSIRVERTMDDGHHVVDAALPALITVTQEINTPRVPTLKGRMRARTLPIYHWDAPRLQIDPAQVGIKGSPTRVLRSFVPERKRAAELLSGEPSELADRVVSAVLRLNVIP